MVENFEVRGENKDVKERVIENLTGIKLFHHIVDTIETANFIRDEIRERGLSGKVSFLPLRQLNPSGPRDFNNDGVRPALEYVQYDHRVERAIK